MPKFTNGEGSTVFWTTGCALFKYGQNNLSFPNFTDGLPDWGTYEDTFGTAEVWHELLDPIFGHPILTAAYFAFYVYFLKGKGGGGLATGFCTSLASEGADRLWTGQNDTFTLALTDSLLKTLTGVHGKLLSRQSLLHFSGRSRESLRRLLQRIGGRWRIRRSLRSLLVCHDPTSWPRQRPPVSRDPAARHDDAVILSERRRRCENGVHSACHAVGIMGSLGCIRS